MKIILVTEAFGPRGFGVNQVLSGLIKLYRKHNTALKVLSPIIEDGELLLTSYESVMVPFRGKKFLWHPSQQKFLRTEIEAFHPDLIHVHGVFTFLQRSAVQAAIDSRVPILISPHGMLDPWLWQQHNLAYTLTKKIYWRSFMKPVLNQADCFHAITESEAAYIRQEFPRRSQVLIPNAIDLDQITTFSERAFPDNTFLFLGRLHPKKGVDLLIQAFCKAHLGDSWRLVIAGPDFNPKYGQQLRHLAEKLHMTERIDFIGPVYGDAKYALLATAWAVVVPSYSEVVALVNLEAAAMQTPTITTIGTGLYDWAESGGLLIEANVHQLTQALQGAAFWTLQERLGRGAQARTFVQERYSWQVVSQHWIEAYQSIAG